MKNALRRCALLVPSGVTHIVLTVRTTERAVSLVVNSSLELTIHDKKYSAVMTKLQLEELMTDKSLTAE